MRRMPPENSEVRAKIFPKKRMYARIIVRFALYPPGVDSAAKKFGNEKKSLGLPLNPLKNLKIVEEMFGKVWTFQASCLEKFGKSLGSRLGRRHHIAEMPPSSFTSAPVMKPLSSEAR